MTKIRLLFIFMLFALPGIGLVDAQAVSAVASIADVLPQDQLEAATFASAQWHPGFSLEEAWRESKNPRLVGDFNGDGLDDFVGFSDTNTIVALSDGTKFTSSEWNSGFTIEEGWDVANNPRLVGDFNGDGLDDFVGFSDTNTLVALSDGTKFNSSIWNTGFSKEEGWEVANNPRLVGDFNGDGLDDFVAFSNSNTIVALSDGVKFTSSEWNSGFSKEEGWDVENNPRLVGDFNGDGLDDFVAFSDTATIVALSDGSKFTTSEWNAGFSKDEGWDVENNPRLVGDFNRDGLDDFVAFSDSNTIVALSDGTKFTASEWNSGFSKEEGWDVSINPRLVGNFDAVCSGQEILAFSDTNTIVALSDGTKFTSAEWNSGFSPQEGWSVEDNPRLVGDFNGDRKDDFVAFSDTNTVVALSQRTESCLYLPYLAR